MLLMKASETGNVAEQNVQRELERRAQKVQTTSEHL